MRKIKKLIITVALVLLGFASWTISHPPEPTYQGKRLSYWLERYHPYSGFYGEPGPDQADDAIREIGTNAIPVYLRILRETDSPLRIKFASQLQKVPFLNFKSTYTPVAIKHHEVRQAFYVLKDRPESAIPPLIEIYNQNISSSSKSTAADILSTYGPKAKAAIPFLLQGTTNDYSDIRATSIHALSRISPDPFLVIPILLTAQHDANYNVSSAAKDALEAFDRNAQRDITTLFERLNAPDDNIRRQATNSLKEIYPELSAQAGFK